MRKYREKYLLSYVLKRSEGSGEFFNFVFWRYLLTSVAFLPFCVLSIGKINNAVLVSGNRNKKFFFSTGDDFNYGCWGVGLKGIDINISRIYIAAFLYCFVSRRFVFLYRYFQLRYRGLCSNSSLDYIFVHSDALPLVRALISIFKPVGIKFVCVQHGIFHQSLENEIDGIKSNYNIVMNESQEKYFLDSNAKNTVVYTNLKSQSIDIIVREKLSRFSSVVVIGEGFYSVSKEINEAILSLYSEIKRMCVSAGLSFCYRPHPAEKKSLITLCCLFLRFKSLCFSDRNLFESDVLYIGIHSSYISKVSAASGLVIQLDLDKQKYGSSHDLGVTSVKISQLCSILESKSIVCLGSSDVRNQYVASYDVSVLLRFLNDFS